MPLNPDPHIMSLMADGRPFLDAALTQVSPHHRLWIALSGGMDSVCLLHMALEAIHYRSRQHLPVPSLHAIHVNHHLQAAAEHFETSCRTLCETLQVPLQVVHVTPQISHAGVEAAARDARYGAFDECLGTDDVLWLAHHCNDQAETFLLRLLRGGGLAGLGGMPSSRRLGRGWLQRPLLNVPHSDLLTLAREQQWQWVDDPSNDAQVHDRNWLRHHIIPALEARWPQVVQTLVHTSDHLRESHQLLMQYAADELERLTSDPACLPVPPLLAMDASRCALLIRCALNQQQLPLPPRKTLNTLIEQLNLSESRCAEVTWSGVVARIWKGHLYLLETQAEITFTNECDWYSFAVSVLNRHVSNSRGNFIVQPRRGGEKLFYNGMHRRVKTLLQQHALPPWERSQLVFVYTSDTHPPARKLIDNGSDSDTHGATVGSDNCDVLSSSGDLDKEGISTPFCRGNTPSMHIKDEEEIYLVAVLSDSLCLVADGWAQFFKQN